MEGGNEDEKDNEHFERAEILKDSKAIWSEADDEYLFKFSYFLGILSKSHF